MKTIISDKTELVEKATRQICELVASKPEAVLALPAGETVRPLYERLAALCESGAMSLKKARIFAVTEFENAPEGLSCREQLEKELIEKTDVKKENCFFLTREALEGYDARIEAEGGLDLAVLGLGHNAHIGFNEPATPFDSLTHAQKLTDATRRQYAARFGGEEKTPQYGLTMGIKTLISAREVMVMAFGEDKAEAAFKMLYGRNDSAVPAAFLQIPLNVTVYLDHTAAQKL